MSSFSVGSWPTWSATTSRWDCPPSLGLLTLNALTAASRLVVVTEASFLALQGIDELLETHELVRAHYNGELELGGVIVNRVERTVEHRESVAEIERYFGAELVWQPLLPKRTAVQDATRRGVPVGELARRPARELAGAFGRLARRMEVSRVAV
jgi:chromosome partitioning protein